MRSPFGPVRPEAVFAFLVPPSFTMLAISLISPPGEDEPAWQLFLLALCGLYVLLFPLLLWKNRGLADLVLRQGASPGDALYVLVGIGATGAFIFVFGLVVGIGRASGQGRAFDERLAEAVPFLVVAVLLVCLVAMITRRRKEDATDGDRTRSPHTDTRSSH